MRLFIVELDNCKRALELAKEFKFNLTSDAFMKQPFYSGVTSFEITEENKIKIFIDLKASVIEIPRVLFSILLKFKLPKKEYEGKIKLYKQKEVINYLVEEWGKKK